MKSTTGSMRRGLFAIFVAAAMGGAVPSLPSLPLMPSAIAAPDSCAASEVAKTIGSVAASTAEYLEGHPRTNQALSTISQQQGGPQSLAAVKTYFDANPQVAKEMQQLQQPLTDLSGRCKLPLTVPQVMGLMQAAQQGGGLPAGLPGGAPPPQTVGLPSAGETAQSPAAPSGSRGAGRLPGPAIAGLP
jgi:heme-binding protein